MTSQVTEKSAVYSKLFCIFGVVMTIMCTTPILNRGVLMGVTAIMVVMAILPKVAVFSIPQKGRLALAVLSYLLVVFFYRLAEVSDMAWGRYIDYVLYSSQFVLVLMLFELRIIHAKWLWWAVVSVILANIIYNILLVYIYPGLVTMGRGADKEFLKSINCGGSTFYVLAMFFFNVCFVVLLNSQQKLVKFIMAVCSVITAIYILFFCFKASVVIYFLLSVALILLAKGNNRVVFIALILVFALLAEFLLSTFADDIISYIVSYSPSERLTKRLVFFIDDQNYNASGTSFEARKGLWLLSLQTWLSSPSNFLFGIGDHFRPEGNNYGIGQHSELLDILAMYGLLGGSLLVYILKEVFALILSLFEKEYHLQIIMIIVVYIACGFTKFIFDANVGCALFMMLPLAAPWMAKYSKQ